MIRERLRTLGTLKTLIAIGLLAMVASSCERTPLLNLHRDNLDLDIPIVDIELDVVWDYKFVYDIEYDWHAEWYYGEDEKLFGGLGEEPIGYHMPTKFELRRYFTGDVQYAPHTKKEEFFIEGYSFTHTFDWGFHDLLVWNDIQPNGDDNAVSIIIDESQTLDSVFAYTNMSTRQLKVPNKANYTRSHFQPEELFSAYDQGEEIDRDLTGFIWDEERGVYLKTLQAELRPLTYIYLTQIILHNNNGRIIGVDGEADLTGMAKSANLNTGNTGTTPIPVNYTCGFKRHVDYEGEDVDIVGGRVMTFGICGLNPYKNTRAPITDDRDPDRHYIDCTFVFNNGGEKTEMFDVTDQVRRYFKGGVLTIHIDVDEIEPPNSSGGSGFDPVIKDVEEEQHEFEMKNDNDDDD